MINVIKKRSKKASLKILSKVLEPFYKLKQKVVFRLFESKKSKSYNILLDDANFFGANKIAVFVGFHKPCFRDSVPKNNLRILRALKNAGYEVLYVHNGRVSDIQVSELSEFSICLIERINLGYDFGAFKVGFEFLFANYPNLSPQNCLVLNDSCVCLSSNSATQFFAAMEVKQECLGCNVISPFINQEYHPHVQSFLFLLDKNTFINESYRNFWYSYTPLSYRKHAVMSGEIGHSKFLLDKGFSIAAYFDSPSTIIKDRKIEEFTSLLPQRYFLEYRRWASQPQWWSTTFLLKSLEEMNHSHSFALILLVYAKYPFLKKDLIYRSTFDCSSIFRALSIIGFEFLEREAYVDVVSEIVNRKSLEKESFSINLALKYFGIK